VKADDISSFNSVHRTTIDVLRLVNQRLQAEMKVKGRNDLKLLARLLSENNNEVRITFATTVNFVIAIFQSWLSLFRLEIIYLNYLLYGSKLIHS